MHVLSLLFQTLLLLITCTSCVYIDTICEGFLGSMNFGRKGWDRKSYFSLFTNMCLIEHRWFKILSNPKIHA